MYLSRRGPEKPSGQFWGTPSGPIWAFTPCSIPVAAAAAAAAFIILHLLLDVALLFLLFLVRIVIETEDAAPAASDSDMSWFVRRSPPGRRDFVIDILIFSSMIIKSQMIVEYLNK